MAFQNFQPNIENLQNYLNENNKRKDFGDGPRWWSIPNGMSSIRILPPWDPSGRIALAVNMHPIEYTPNGSQYKKYNWTCLNKTFGKPCKICEGLEQMSAAGVDVHKYEASRRKFYMNAIIMYDPRYDADIKAGKKPEDASGVAPGTHVLLNAPKTLYDWVIAQITNPMVGDITSITSGIDIYITKEGSGLGTQYTPTLSPNGRQPIPQEYLEKIESLYNLDEIFSKGFEDELMNELVDHLKKSAGVMAASVPGVVQQMAGYQTPAVTSPPAMTQGYVDTGFPDIPNPYSTPVPQVPNMQSAPPVQNPYATINTIPPAPASPFAPGAPMSPAGMNPVPTPTAPSMVPPAPVQSAPTPSTSPMDMNLPKCFGRYDPSQVTCVVCPAEVNCSQKSGR